jgi:hypothetical protein
MSWENALSLMRTFELVRIVTPSVAVEESKAGGGRRNVHASTSLSLYNPCAERFHALKFLTLRTTASVTRAEQHWKAPAVRAVAAAPAALAVVAASPAGAPPPAAADALPTVAQVAMLGTPFFPATVPPPVGTLTQYIDLPESQLSPPLETANWRPPLIQRFMRAQGHEITAIISVLRKLFCH